MLLKMLGFLRKSVWELGLVKVPGRTLPPRVPGTHKPVRSKASIR